MIRVAASLVVVFGVAASAEEPGLPPSPFDASGKVATPDKPAQSSDGQQQTPAADPKTDNPPTAAELKAAIVRGQLERKIKSLLGRAKFPSRGDRPGPDDHFVVALFHMPLETREAELRFQVLEGTDDAADELADYVQNTPSGTVRDLQVVARFKSAADADAGLQLSRQRYDQAKEYQAQLLAYLQQQQRRAASMRRC